jgi:hypothetical protein
MALPLMAMSNDTRRALLVVAAVVVAGGALIVGSVLYWRADGSVGTPTDFTDRVAATGLDVNWSNAGPRAGDGVVHTVCGPVEVTVNDLAGQLWLSTANMRRPLTAKAIDELITCVNI